MATVNAPKIFKSSSAPSGTEDAYMYSPAQCGVDDLWLDTATSTLKRCTSTTPYTWVSIEGSSSGPAPHTLESHSSKAHSELTSVGAGDHHAQSHGNAEHTAAPTPSTQAFGDAAVIGTDAGPSRGDHKHAMMADPVTAHAAAADPHTGYQLESEKGVVNGYASLDAGGTVPDAQIPAAIARDSELHAESHTLVSHSARAHSDLTGIGATDHHSNANDHPQSHGAADHSGDVIPAANQDFGAFYSDIAQIAAPANPGAGVRRVFVDSADGKLKVKTDSGSSVSLEEQGGGNVALTDLTDVTITSPAEGQVVRKGAGDWVNAQLAHADLGSVTSDQHHAQAHTLSGSDHTGALVEAQTPLTTKGDLLVSDGTTLQRVPVGANDQVLTADSAQANGVKWAAAAGGAGAAFTLVALTVDRVNNNATANTLQDVTDLSFAVTAGKTYIFRFYILYTSAASTTGSRWTLNGPSATYLIYTSRYTLTLTTQTLNAMLTAYGLPTGSNASSNVSNGGGNMAIIEGIIRPSASGTVIARFASEVANSAITAKVGSLLEYREAA